MALNDLVIRSFQPDDLFQCQNIIRSVYKDYGHIDAYAEGAISSDMADIQQNYLDISGGHWWVAVLDKQHIIGQIGIQPLAIGDQDCYQDVLIDPQSSSYITSDQICELRRLAVLSKYQRQQVGSKLVQTLIEYARKIEYKAIHLTTLISMEAACRFYDKYGFLRGKIDRYDINVDSNNTIINTKSAVFNNLSALTDYDHRLLHVPIFESHRKYNQHYWMKLH